MSDTAEQVINGIPVQGERFVESVFAWNKVGQSGCISQPGVHFDADRVGFNIGMQLEELAETITAVVPGCVDSIQRRDLQTFATSLTHMGNAFKRGNYLGAVLRSDREELLDASIDVAFVSINSLIYQTPRYMEALSAVLTANANKFPYGNVLRDGNGKILKPVGWKAPDLRPFVDFPAED